MGTLKHASGDFGENLAFKCGSDLKEYKGDMPAIAWYVTLNFKSSKDVLFNSISLLYIG